MLQAQIIHYETPFQGGRRVCFRTHPGAAGEAAERLKDREALLFRSESSEYCYLIIAKILVIINKKEHEQRTI